jgi:hypothetical protein
MPRYRVVLDGLPPSARDEDLVPVLQVYGMVTAVKIITNFDREPLGVGIASIECAVDAMRKLCEADLIVARRPISVALITPHKDPNSDPVHAEAELSCSPDLARSAALRGQRAL